MNCMGPGRREGRHFSWIQVQRFWKNLEQGRVARAGWQGGMGGEEVRGAMGAGLFQAQCPR